MSEGPLIDVFRPVIPLKLDFARKLFNNIPNSVVDKWELKGPDKKWPGNPGFRFNKQKLSAVYYAVKSKISNHALIKYSLPDFKFECIYVLQPKEIDSKGRQIERRYDKDGNIESEYARDEFKKGPGYVKTKSKDKEVNIPYIWGDDPKPLDNIDEIRPYLVESPTRFEWFHKKDKPEDKYVTFLLSSPFFKRNKK